jgi:hypothetical protein
MGPLVEEFSLLPAETRIGESRTPQPPAGGGRGEGVEGAREVIFPTVLFVFPAMFVVVLGSALLNLNDYFWSAEGASGDRCKP